jgi:precorrin-2/cobalt-factor-2 C20-methyltransferase
VRKSSIYLPDELKQLLEERAERSGRSEADLIRAAIGRLLAMPAGADDGGGPDRPLASSVRPALVGVGVGPGDPGLITTTGRATLLAADRVLVITTDDHSVGRAEMVVRSVAPAVRLQRVPFAIVPDEAHREASLQALAGAVLTGTDAGELVAVAVLGDPSQWSVFPALAAAVRQLRTGLHVVAVPGITAYQASASRAAVALGGAGGALVVVDNLAELDRRLGDAQVVVVVYKASVDGADVQAIAARHHRHAVVAELNGLPGERLVDLADLPAGPISYLATVIFPALDHDRVPS